MKGFATVLVAASVFLIAILLLSNTSTTDISYNSNFSEMKIRISNYEVVMLQIAQDCNWDKTVSEINSCLNTGSSSINPALNMPNTICSITQFSADKDTNTAFNQINCNTEIDSGNDGYFSNKITKIIRLKKYP